ncbi:MAG: acetylxylan esterase [Phycisphaerae bacterium]|nr:acetylxylan esterase [Phycisphaerae bacterium]
MKMTIRLICIVVLLVTASGWAAGDSLTPLKLGKSPTTWQQLWGNYDPAKDPLEIQIVREWKEDGITFRYVIFTIGTFKGQKSTLAAYYAFPASSKKLPAILHLHGGGQRAFLSEVREAAKYGYPALSINHGGRPMEDQKPGEPNTDWGKMDENFDHIKDSQRNDFWFRCQLAAKRGLTFLAQQPEVDPARIGVHGHSVGGRMTTEIAADSRVAAAVPSSGGGGAAAGPIALMPGSNKKPSDPIKLKTILTNAYLPNIKCPILNLNPMNEWTSPTDIMFENWKNIASKEVSFSSTPHIYHHHLPEHKVCQWLWFEQHLNDSFNMPKTPKCQLNLNTPSGIPSVTLIPEKSMTIEKVDIYYSIDPHPITRFWRDAKAQQQDGIWKTDCPIMSTDQPLCVIANVTYKLEGKMRGKYDIDKFTITSWEQVALPKELKQANVKPTDKPSMLIDDFARGWHDWYPFIECKPGQLDVMTRKLKDPKYQGPDGAVLKLDVLSPKDNQLVIAFLLNAWSTDPKHRGGGYGTVKNIKGSDKWQTVDVSLSELIPTTHRYGAEYRIVTEPMADWTHITDFKLCTKFIVSKNGEEIQLGTGRWNGYYQFRNLRWELSK